MSYTDHIKTGIDYLLKSQNDDGGIIKDWPGNEEKLSGVWTTAESLEAILEADCLQFNISTLDNLILMANYLIEKFISNGDCGYWEIFDKQGPSTMTTGHVIFALITFSNKILTNCDLEAIFISGKKFTVSDIKQKIVSCTEKGLKWLQANQQMNNGWSYTLKSQGKQSTNLCTYYVLKGYQALGKTCSNDDSMNKACIFIKQKIVELVSSKRDVESSLGEVLYGFTCLYCSGYFIKSEDEFKKTIIKYINRHWKKIEKYVNFDDPFAAGENISAYENYVNNIPYIALKAFLLAEEFTFSKKLVKLTDYLIKNKKDGEWAVYKKIEKPVGLSGKEKNTWEIKKETTWVTAEAILALNQAQQKFLKYQNNVIRKQKERNLTVMNIILSVILAGFLIYFAVHPFVSQGNMETTLGVVGSIASIIGIVITIVGAIKK